MLTRGSGCPPRVPPGPVCVGARFGLAVDGSVERLVDCRLRTAFAAVLGAGVGTALRAPIAFLASDTAADAHPQAGLGGLAGLRAILANAGRMVRRRAALPHIGCLATAPLWEEAVDRVAWLGFDQVRVRRAGADERQGNDELHLAVWRSHPLRSRAYVRTRTCVAARGRREGRKTPGRWRSANAHRRWFLVAPFTIWYVVVLDSHCINAHAKRAQESLFF